MFNCDIILLRDQYISKQNVVAKIKQIALGHGRVHHLINDCSNTWCTFFSCVSLAISSWPDFNCSCRAALADALEHLAFSLSRVLIFRIEQQQHAHGMKKMLGSSKIYIKLKHCILIITFPQMLSSLVTVNATSVFTQEDTSEKLSALSS